MSEVDFRLLLITDRRCTGESSLLSTISKAVATGVRAMQLREKDLSARELYALAVQLKAICQKSDCRLFINDRIDIANSVKAGGLHLPANGISPEHTRKLLSSDMLLGISTHSVTEAMVAEQAGVDYIIFGPVYPTASKLQYGAPLGLRSLHKVVGSVQIPVFAIGGITPRRAAECRSAGAHGIAVISAILSADDPVETVTLFKERLGTL